MPKNTVEKLNRIEVEGMTSLSPLEIGDLTDSYKYFLHLYHMSQVAYREKSEIEIGFDAKDVRDRSESIVKLCAKRILR